MDDPNGYAERRLRGLLMLSYHYDVSLVGKAVSVHFATVDRWRCEWPKPDHPDQAKIVKDWDDNADRMGRAVLELAAAGHMVHHVLDRFNVTPAQFAKWALRALNDVYVPPAFRAARIEDAFRDAGFRDDSAGGADEEGAADAG